MSNIIVTDPQAQLQLLNQKLDIIVKDFNSVLTEMQVVQQTMAKVMRAATEVQEKRLANLEAHVQVLLKSAGHIAEESTVPVSEVQKG